jgi:hypothetical protein
LSLEPESRPTRWVEWVTIVALLLMALSLLYVNVSLSRRRKPPEVDTFDLKNPMLDARPGECVEVYDASSPGSAPCFRVRQEGVVLRPAQGPASVGDQHDLKRFLPYLAVDMRVYESSGTCATGGAPDSEQTFLYPLNAFGLPKDTLVRPDTLRPLWVELRGQERLIYEVVLEDVARSETTWVGYVSPEAGVTGLVEVQAKKANTKPSVFRYSPPSECP